MLIETKDCIIEAEQKEGCLLIAHVSFSAPFVKNIHKKAIKTVNKEISIPGFRKGKVPEEIILKKFGPHVDQEWKELLVNEAVNATLRQTKLYPLTKKSFQKTKIEECSLEGGAKITLSYEHYPQIPFIDFGTISLPKKEIPAVNEQEIQDVIEEIQESRAQWHEVTDRPIQESDYVDLTLEALEGDNVRPLANKRRFHVFPKKMGTWMQNALIGKSINDVVEADSAPDENATEEFKNNFKKTRIRITIHAIFQAELPELNEELIKTIGAPSLDALKERIRTDLENESRAKQSEERYDALQEILLQKYVFNIPQTLIDKEKRERIEMKIRELRKQNLSEEDIKDQVNASQEALSEEARKAISLFFIKRQIVEQGRLEVTNAELNYSLTQLYARSSQEPSENVINNLTDLLLQKKIKDYALSQVPA